MDFFGSSKYDIVLARASNERPLSRIGALPPTLPLRAFSCYARGSRFPVGGPREMGFFRPPLAKCTIGVAKRAPGKFSP